MTVKELIVKLQQFDENLPVVCRSNGWDCDMPVDPTPELQENVVIPIPGHDYESRNDPKYPQAIML